MSSVPESSRSFSRILPAILVGMVVLLSTLMLTVFYAQTSAPPPVNSITVTSSLLDGSSLSGVRVDLRINGTTLETRYTPATFTHLTPGIQYIIVVYWLNNYYFRHFSDGELDRYETVTLNGSNYIIRNALYEYIPPSQVASLDIQAEFSNGTQIGTSLTYNDTNQHTPGMWTEIVPPGQTTPYTGTFTGGSILPFILFNHESYTLEMSAGYGRIHFSHWKDNNSINPTRTITLNGNTTYIAIYDET